MYSRNPKLFVTPEGHKVPFFVSLPSPDLEIVKSYIQAGGGCIESSPYGPYTIIICNDCTASAFGKRDVFHSDFVILSSISNTLASMKMHRIRESRFPSNFQPIDIFNQRVSWTQVQDGGNISERLESLQELEIHSGEPQSQPILEVLNQSLITINSLVPKVILQRIDLDCLKAVKRENRESRESSVSLEEADGNISSGSSVSYHSSEADIPLSQRLRSKSFSNQRGSRNSKSNRNYTKHEDRVILAYVKENSSSNKLLAGNVFWKNFEKSQVLPGRSWQSLRGRYLNYLFKESSHKAIDLKEKAVKLDKQPANSCPVQCESVSLENQQVPEVPQKTKKLKRRLFTPKPDFQSPQPSANLPTPISISKFRRGPSVMQQIINNHERSMAQKKRQLARHKKKQCALSFKTSKASADSCEIVSNSGDYNHSNVSDNGSCSSPDLLLCEDKASPECPSDCISKLHDEINHKSVPTATPLSLNEDSLSSSGSEDGMNWQGCTFRHLKSKKTVSLKFCPETSENMQSSNKIIERSKSDSLLDIFTQMSDKYSSVMLDSNPNSVISVSEKVNSTCATSIDVMNTMEDKTKEKHVENSLENPFLSQCNVIMTTSSLDVEESQSLDTINSKCSSYVLHHASADSNDSRGSVMHKKEALHPLKVCTMVQTDPVEFDDAHYKDVAISPIIWSSDEEDSNPLDGRSSFTLGISSDKD